MQSTCSVETCNVAAVANGFCSSHYQRFKKHGTPYRPCQRCGDDLPLGTNGRTKLCKICKNNCSIDGCGRPVRRNGMCAPHSHRVQVYGAVERKCRACGKNIPPEAGVGKRYCSDECKPVCVANGCQRKVLAKGLCKEHYRRKEHNGSISRTCLTCGKEFPIGATRGRKYCSDECKPKCIVQDCADIVEMDGHCPRHAAMLRKNGHLSNRTFTCVYCGETITRSYGERYIKNTRKVCTECAAVRKRDHGWFRKKVIESGRAECGICGDDIDLALKWPDKASLSIDHIIPLALGGTNRESNLQPAHAGCNIQKGARIKPNESGLIALF